MTRVALLCLLRPLPAGGESAQVVRVLDGDTADFRIAGIIQRVRVAQIDAPESRLCPPGANRTNGCAKCAREVELGLAAKRAAEGLLPVGGVVELQRAPGRDKWGRVLARITLPSGEDFGSVMLQRGLAVEYHGRKKKDWCSDGRTTGP